MALNVETARDGVAIGAWIDFAARIALNGPSGPFTLDVELTVEKGTFVAIVGPSGAGKTTLLRLIAGLARPDEGRVRVGAEMWCDTSRNFDIPVRHRGIGFVFQDYALFPNMTVRRNVEYAIGSRSQSDEVQRLLDMVELAGLAEAYPARLSGGQKQRLALIRALARRPQVLMLDEPLSALDPEMRRQLQDELKRLHKSFGTTTFLVSHDMPEILRLADRVVRLEQGRVAFDGAPLEALGIKGAAEGLCLTGTHVAGPDKAGCATVAVDGRLCQVRYANGLGAGLTPGDTVVLRIADVQVSAPRL